MEIQLLTGRHEVRDTLADGLAKPLLLSGVDTRLKPAEGLTEDCSLHETSFWDIFLQYSMWVFQINERKTV